MHLSSGTSSLRPLALVLLAGAVVLAAVFAVSDARMGAAVDEPPDAWMPRIRESETPPPGWRAARGPHLSDEEEAALERLESLGYLAGGASAPAASGVTIHDESASWDGLNLYVSGDFPGARLIDMDGNVVHEWSCTFLEAWPDRREEYDRIPGARFWFNAHLFENGDIIGVFNGLGLVKLDRDSNIIWRYEGGSHHDLHVDKDGVIYAITQERKLDPRVSEVVDLMDDAITTISPDGRELDRVSVMEAFWNSDYASALRTLPSSERRAVRDVFHANRIVALEGRLQESIPSFHEGNFLLSLRDMSTLAVIDMDTEQVTWAMSGQWLRQHCPSVLKNGNILLFDNQGNYGASRVIEFDPVTQEIVWEFSGDEETDLYSEKFGTAQRLPNGNTLIAESHFGRALEVTREGEVVWEFYNPSRAGDRDELIANLYEIQRLPQGFPTDWLN